ncbi:DNA-binding NarL/FixJ family response regulator [Microbacterium halimionae]|uniref:DNA-binding NarL/FixJ family response regulator n=1 Tax=Microbacterium halimionae TaxID=1526413 RepID=A0A7W3JN68_9MICO|nr:response regulator transcription factor [Microbacterium halimionae]MBA8815947.1 DNA-binding NarL/FixJ family response regulator [Microbacterium halimionae]NII96150.1 DNA-binding NarL/FixJ family response regulator [Microbacterium halimionae]
MPESASTPISVLIVDDQQLIRMGFRMILDAEDDVDVVGEASDGSEGIERAMALKPDVILMDVRMPRIDGITATRQIVSAQPSARIIVLTTFDLDEYAFGALHAGASGFLLKDVRAPELTSAIRAVHNGDAMLSPRVTRKMLDLFSHRVPSGTSETPTQSLPLAELTPRELDVFREIADGKTNAEIATVLFLSESTVKTHVGRILGKLQARDRIHLVILAYEWDVVPGDS